MTNVAIVADVQLGNHKRFGGPVVGSMNTRCRMILGVLRKAVERAVAEKCDHFVVCGDLFDYVRPEAPMIAAVQDILQYGVGEGLSFVLLRGNHDMVSTLEGDSALAPLRPYARVVDKPEVISIGGAAILAIPFQPGSVDTWLPDVVAALAACPERYRMIAMHMGIRDEKTPPWLAGSQGAVAVTKLFDLARKHNVRAVFAGDWHARRAWRDMTYGPVDVLQVGALVPTGWDNPGMRDYGTLAFWRPAEVKPVSWVELPGPRFLKVRSSMERDTVHGDVTRPSSGGDLRIYVSHDAPPEDVERETAFWSAVAANLASSLGGFEVLPDGALAKEEARQAASAARSTETLQEALVTYVKHMPLKDGVRRAAVLERAKEYLKS